MAEHETEPTAKRRRLPQPLPKHTIFLSHSGNEKAFAEQLCEDLNGMNHYPFFDQDSDSLPKGERFPSLIFSAAEQCWLAVVVLSEGYLSSKWPMLELSTFVKSMKGRNPNLKLFPVFYKLSPSDLSAEQVETKWKEFWKKLVEEGKVSAEEIASWSDAVRELRVCNGMEFSKYGTSEVKYRAAVVEEICNNVPPMMKYKTDDIRGYERLCEITSRMFEEGTSEEITCREGCYYLGLYGLGGVGKSTLCKAMCNYFQEKYGMRVCHVELPSIAEDEPPSAARKHQISRLKSVIQELTRFGTKIVDNIHSESQGLEWLQNRLRGHPPVFLAVDNVEDSESSRDEARALVKSVLAAGSKVLVTSRSQAILKSVFYEEKYYKPITRLEAHEARELFLSVAAPKKLLCPLQSSEEKILEACLEECRFAEDGYVAQQYHPLILRALGSYFHDLDEDNIMKWKEYLLVENKLQGSRESKRVKDILGLNYSSLDDSTKLMFLDVALLLNAYGRKFIEKVGFKEKVKNHKWSIYFIATLHGLSRLVVERKVKELQRKSLIYESSGTLGMHDLYMEFAKSLVMKEGSKERKWWVDLKNWAIGINFGLAKRLLVEWGEVEIVLNPQQLRQCEKLECLVLDFCQAPRNSSLDLRGLKSLRVLILEDVLGMVEIVCNCEGEGDKGYLQELQIVHLCGKNLERIPFIRHCYNLKSLLIELMTKELVDYIYSAETNIFEKLKALELLCLRYIHSSRNVHLEEFFINVSTLQSLRVLKLNLNLRCSSFWEPTWSELPLCDLVTWRNELARRGLDVSPLGRLPSLSTLSLHLPMYKEVQGLEHLSRLTTLGLHCFQVLEFKGVDQLSHLTMLDLRGCPNLCVLPNLDILPNLEEVCIFECCSLEDSMRSLERYQEIGHDKFHKCHQPFCNRPSCRFCSARHERSSVKCQPQGHCSICYRVDCSTSNLQPSPVISPGESWMARWMEGG